MGFTSATSGPPGLGPLVKLAATARHHVAQNQSPSQGFAMIWRFAGLRRSTEAWCSLDSDFVLQNFDSVASNLKSDNRSPAVLSVFICGKLCSESISPRGTRAFLKHLATQLATLDPFQTSCYIGPDPFRVQ
jgi:hypothetical protein